MLSVPRNHRFVGLPALRMASIRKSRKVVIVSQHYAPDPGTTAGIITTIATHLAKTFEVLVLSGTSGAIPHTPQNADQPIVVEIKNSISKKTALIKRALFEAIFAIRTFIALLTRLSRGDVVLTVTAPFILPHAVTAAARIRRAQTILILHDLYPDVLATAGLLQPTSIATKIIRVTNGLMFRALNAIVIIGRDMEDLLMRYKGMTRDKIMFIPNWATLRPGVRPKAPRNIYRSQCDAAFVVGLSGNLGFTHDPDVVFDAAVLLQNDPSIHFLLSGWGMGFERLKARLVDATLTNITLIDRVPEEKLEEFLSAADIWIIPYRRNVAGVSVPSRFYNLLAVGRPVLIISEPDAEAALTVKEDRLGWVVTPGDARELAATIKIASDEEITLKGVRAAEKAIQFSVGSAMTKYQSLVERILRERRTETV
jgi:colanic acid biosynthesis glycosyl transferase WcaI